MHIQHFFDSETATFTYVVSDASTKACAIIDSVLNYDMNAGRTTTASADQVIQYVQQNQLKTEWILETHIHADHLTAAQYLKKHLGGKIGIGAHITEVLAFWVALFNSSQDTPLDGSQFDHLFQNEEEFQIGSLSVKVLHTPGHTPACSSYLINNQAVFVGDTIFMPYMGTARTDFPGGSAETLYQSIQKILSLPEETAIYTGHDYPPQGAAEQCRSTVLEQKQSNTMVHSGVSQKDYVLARNNKDQGKAVPRLLLPAIQINLRAGSFGHAEINNVHYVKIPLNQI